MRIILIYGAVIMRIILNYGALILRLILNKSRPKKNLTNWRELNII